MTKTWKAKVYKPNKYKYNQLTWKETEIVVFNRDRCKCMACFKRSKSLTCHHIIPRCEGGSDDIDNLITLCIKCHNEIEQTAIRSRFEIVTYNLPENVCKRNEYERRCKRSIEEMLTEIDAHRPEWHAKVYGGNR
jgi:5-methylcytosine-specific restriction endonuclease McrA